MLFAPAATPRKLWSNVRRTRISSLCRTKISPMGDGTNRPADDALARQLLCARGVDTRRDHQNRDEYPDAPLSLIPNAPRPSKYLQTKCAPPKRWCTTAAMWRVIRLLLPLKQVCCTGCKECPDKKFIPAPTEKCACNECHFMKMNTLEKSATACVISRRKWSSRPRSSSAPSSPSSACSNGPRGSLSPCHRWAACNTAA